MSTSNRFSGLMSASEPTDKNAAPAAPSMLRCQILYWVPRLLLLRLLNQ